MRTSPTARSMKYLRDKGWQVARVERWNPFAHIRQDVWRFGDILACRRAVILDGKGFVYGIALVQSTSVSNFSKRRTKILALAESQEWKAAGGLVLLHGWGKQGPRGKRKTWQLREEML